MATTAYLKLEGPTQGKIEGKTDKGIEIRGFQHIIATVVDAVRGTVGAGTTHHDPMTIWMDLDTPGAPLLLGALSSGERMKTWELLVYQQLEGKQGEQLTYTIKLESAVVTQLATMDEGHAGAEVSVPQMKVGFSYAKVIHSNHANKHGECDWGHNKQAS